jgi:hypothetical protein
MGAAFIFPMIGNHCMTKKTIQLPHYFQEQGWYSSEFGDLAFAKNH